MHDELCAAAQRSLTGGVHVTDDHARLQARVEQRVGATVDGDDHRPHVADERAQGPQVALVPDATDDDQRRTVAEVRRKARQLDPASKQLALLTHVLDRVLREALERLVDLQAPGLRVGVYAPQVEDLARASTCPLRRTWACGAPAAPSTSTATLAGSGRMTTGSPSETASNSESSGRSTSRIPASTSSCGPRFGYDPPEDGLQLSTATAPAAISSSAETRSMSRWSISATSPRTRCPTSSFVRLPGRIGPATVPACASSDSIDRVTATAARVTPATPKRDACSGFANW